VVLKNVRKILLILLLMFPVISLAAGEWCLVRDGIEFCQYSSSEACYGAAEDSGGDCRQNYRAVGSKGGARWCVVTATNRECRYGAAEGCLRAAREVNGGCVENIERALTKAQSGGFGTMADGCAEGDLSCELGIQDQEIRTE
jgi:hypothetical protein